MRVLDAEKYNKTQHLADSAKDFCDKVAHLNEIVKSVVDAVDQQVRGGRERPRPGLSASAEKNAPAQTSPSPPNYDDVYSSSPAPTNDPPRPPFPLRTLHAYTVGGAHGGGEVARGGKAQPGVSRGGGAQAHKG